MVNKIKQLQQLEQLARIKAERQLKSFAAFNTLMGVARARVDALHVTLAQSYDSAAPLTLPEARLANAQAGRAARELRHADQELTRLMPRFQIARQQAAREFGRAEALLDLTRTALHDQRRDRS